VTEVRHEKGRKRLSAQHRVNFLCANRFVIHHKEVRGANYVVQDGTAYVPSTRVEVRGTPPMRRHLMWHLVRGRLMANGASHDTGHTRDVPNVLEAKEKYMTRRCHLRRHCSTCSCAFWVLCASVSKVTVLGTSVSPVCGVYIIGREQRKSEDKRAFDG
jgi:hypothetical protein